jgi:hypothetical protein
MSQQEVPLAFHALGQKLQMVFAAEWWFFLVELHK